MRVGEVESKHWGMANEAEETFLQVGILGSQSAVALLPMLMEVRVGEPWVEEACSGVQYSYPQCEHCG